MESERMIMEDRSGKKDNRRRKIMGDRRSNGKQKKKETKIIF